MARVIIRRWFFLWSFLLASLGCLAHPISMSSAISDVRTNEVVVELDIMVEDLVLFRSIEAGEDGRFHSEPLKEAAKDHADWLNQRLQLLDGGGKRLSGQLGRTDFSGIPEAGVDPEQLMAYTVRYQFLYPLQSRPDYLTYVQNFGDTNSVVPSVMELMVLREGLYLEDPVQVLPRRPHTISLDWERTLTPDQASDWKQMKEAREKRLESRLGIASYSGLYSYLYIEAEEVRHEILVPLTILETWLDVPRADPSLITVAEQQALKASLEAFFQSHHPVEIDGVRVFPLVDRLDYYGPDSRDLATRPEPRDLNVWQARAGIILSFPAKQPPTRVRVEWDVFNSSTRFLRSVILPEDQTATEVYFEPAHPVETWETDSPFSREGLRELPVPATVNPWKFSWFQSLGIALLALSVGWLILGRGRFRRPVFFLLAAGLLMLFVSGGPALEWSPPWRSVPPPSLAQQGRILDLLLGNIYRALDQSGEEGVLDTLDQSVSGDLLETLHRSMVAGLRMSEQGGARARVEKVEMVSAQVSEDVVEGASDGGFSLHATWKVLGRMEHWGHIHQREDEYQALFRVGPVEGAWRVLSFQPLGQRRLSFQTGLRTFN